jgi:class 3 adenylate cyclase
MLPRSVADSLKAGVSVTPQLYASASVLFTDIVDFTVLCGSSTPLQIVSMLNTLFSEFDATVSAHDAYKVGPTAVTF